MENKNMIDSKNETLITCKICKMPFRNLVKFIEHLLMHNNPNLQRSIIKHKKLRKFTYCIICCTNYESIASLILHYQKYHLKLNKKNHVKIYEEYKRLLKLCLNNIHYNLTGQNMQYDQTNLIKDCFDNEIKQNENKYNTSSFENENIKTVGVNEAMNYESLNVNLSKANDVIAENNLNVSNNDNSKILKDQTKQQSIIINYCAPSTSKDNSINVCYNGITCEMCTQKFTFQYEYENHIDNTHLNVYLAAESKENESNNENEKCNAKKKLKEASTEHMKALNNFPLLVQPFECQLCNKKCALPEHFEVYGWLNG